MFMHSYFAICVALLWKFKDTELIMRRQVTVRAELSRVQKQGFAQISVLRAHHKSDK